MEGPYRDLGGGFARLTGGEGPRRSPPRLRSVEDALYELLRNSRDAGARNIYVASSLKSRRYRTLVVIDDGPGIPQTYRDLVFDPGVTTRHLDPVADLDETPHGAGLSLYHIKNAALVAEVPSASSPTAVKVMFDTLSLPEKSYQSSPHPGSPRLSRTNLPATLATFAEQPNLLQHLYHGSHTRILARLLKDRIIQRTKDERSAKTVAMVMQTALDLGLEMSLRTVRRVVAGEVEAAEEVTLEVVRSRSTSDLARRNGAGGPILTMSEPDLARIRTVLRQAARSSYLDLGGLEVERRPGEIVVKARVYEPEEEYE